MSLKELAKEVVKEITSNKPERITSYGTPIYIGINEENKIMDSTLPYILDIASVAVIIIPFTYTVIENSDQSQYVFFIGTNGIPSDSIEKDGWKLKFDEPYTLGYKTKYREAIISNGQLELQLPTKPNITPLDIERIWKIFMKIRKDITIYELQYLADLYKNMNGCPYSYYPSVIKR